MRLVLGGEVARRRGRSSGQSRGPRRGAPRPSGAVPPCSWCCARPARAMGKSGRPPGSPAAAADRSRRRRSCRSWNRQPSFGLADSMTDPIRHDQIGQGAAMKRIRSCRLRS